MIRSLKLTTWLLLTTEIRWREAFFVSLNMDILSEEGELEGEFDPGLTCWGSHSVEVGKIFAVGAEGEFEWSLKAFDGNKWIFVS